MFATIALAVATTFLINMDKQECRDYGGNAAPIWSNDAGRSAGGRTDLEPLAIPVSATIL
jgi:hypothetical protein